MARDGAIDYLELHGADLPAMKAFYGAAFGWRFVDYGADYVGLAGAGLDGGFQSQEAAAPLPILYAGDLEAAVARVERAGGTIRRPIFAFPGGRRFHFRDPAGNELAVWSDRPAGP
ncbi:VOC family protein [Prosthecomicrobium pneumaticum]|uniref:VOC domain-containing protein n=1 Tax=Prosthecomicrobium pneumaticum TaxID=81895 RepID=A0A7W9L461_9HYPH|nr:VOC family protein [Prosthecomicrobium pneumaticum]MBB5755270.1 hypothetical protein [Prosthecomicrobium pneumaticum]